MSSRVLSFLSYTYFIRFCELGRSGRGSAPSLTYLQSGERKRRERMEGIMVYNINQLYTTFFLCLCPWVPYCSEEGFTEGSGTGGEGQDDEGANSKSSTQKERSHVVRSVSRVIIFFSPNPYKNRTRTRTSLLKVLKWEFYKRTQNACLWEKVYFRETIRIRRFVKVVVVYDLK